MDLRPDDITKFVEILKTQMSLSTCNYAQISFLLKKFERLKNEESLQAITNLNLLMALLHYTQDSRLPFKKYFAAAVHLSEKMNYQFQHIIEYLRPTAFGSSVPTMENQFTGTEASLVHLLSGRKLDKHTLIEKLYGTSIDFFTAENRLKNLIFRIRKKKKGLIIYKDGFFELMHKNF